MAGSRTRAAWADLRRLFGAGTVSGLSEWQLLERYALRRDEAAFAAIVARHAPMVLGVCRRLLDDPDDVEDAFQATFLVLVRKADALRPNDAVGNWLYGVACRVAMGARSDRARRRSKEKTGVAIERISSQFDLRDADLGAILDAELKRLPATYRAAVVLCYLEGLTHEEAARQLGWPLGTVKGRLSRARDLLRDRLTRRGIGLTTGVLFARLSREARGAVPKGWAETVIKAAVRASAGDATAGLIRASAVALAEGAIRTMVVNPWKGAVVVISLFAAVTAGAGALGQKSDGGDTPKTEAATRHKEADAEQPLGTSDKVLRRDAAMRGNPLEPPAPESPTAAPKTAEPVDPDRWRKMAERWVNRSKDAFGSDALSAFKLAFESYRMGRLDEATVHLWSRRLADAETDPANRLKALQGHLKRMKDLEQLVLARDDAGLAPTGPYAVPPLNRLNAKYYRQEAERLVAEAGKAVKKPAVSVTTADGARVEADRIDLQGAVTITYPSSAGTGPGKDPRSKAVLKSLETPLEMSFVNETPLEDLLKYIKMSTKSADFPRGVPIYVDPIGLQEAEKTMTSPITMDLDGVPLMRTLQLALSQLGLIFLVQDGMIYITSGSSENVSLPPPIMENWLRAITEVRLERGELTIAERKAYIEYLKDLKEIERLKAPEPGTGGSRQ